MLEVQLQQTHPIPLDVAFDCAPGELLALVGPSGSGKSTVLRAMAGLLRSPGLEGRVQLQAHTPWFDSAQGLNIPPQQRRIGMVFQSYALFPHLNAIENVAIAADKTRARAYFDDLFERLGLAGLQQRKPAQLSGGQQQRVALARALAREPQVLLLDEPFSAVDAPTRQTLYHALAALRQSLAIPMVLVTHDLHEARRLADQLVIVDAGRSLQTGPPAQVFASPRNARVAELVGIQNRFSGRFFSADTDNYGRLLWEASSPSAPASAAPLVLQVVDKKRLPDGAQVSWVLVAELLDVLPHTPAMSPSDDANWLACELSEILPLGEISLCTLIPQAVPGQRITLNLSGALLRQWGGTQGSRLWLKIPAHAVHIMPIRHT